MIAELGGAWQGVVRTKGCLVQTMLLLAGDRMWELRPVTSWRGDWADVLWSIVNKQYLSIL